MSGLHEMLMQSFLLKSQHINLTVMKHIISIIESYSIINKYSLKYTMKYFRREKKC